MPANPRLGSRAPFPSLLLSLALACSVLGASALSEAEAKTYYPDCATELRYKPNDLVVFCGDGGGQAKRLHWYRWGVTEARARTRSFYVNNCQPSCAGGRFIRFQARIVLYRSRACPVNDRRVFTRMAVIFVGRKWDGPRKFTQRLFCKPLSAGASRVRHLGYPSL